MAELKNQMRSHVRAAKVWLGRAEQSFDEENEIRGDLNLMLARAELERAREAKAPNRKDDMISLLTHGALVVGLISLLLVAGFSGFIFGDAKPANSVIPVVPVKQVAPIHLQQNAERQRGEPQKEAPRSIESAPVIPAESAEVKPKIDTSRQNNAITAPKQAVEPAVDLPPAQMQRLMRAAGKSLRGE